MKKKVLFVTAAVLSFVSLPLCLKSPIYSFISEFLKSELIQWIARRHRCQTQADSLIWPRCEKEKNIRMFGKKASLEPLPELWLFKRATRGSKAKAKQIQHLGKMQQ